MIKRILENRIKEKFFKGKAIIITGARQVGKTTLVKMILEKVNEPYLYLNCDEPDVSSILSSSTSVRLKNIIGKNKIIFIDEAQRVENIGITIKLITDEIKNVQVIVTGSSSLELAGKLREPLTGRKYEFELFPISFEEMVLHSGLLSEIRMLNHRLAYGYYPEVVTKPGEEKEILISITESYLYKDLLSFGKIKKPVVLQKIVRALSYQIGSEVSFKELGDLTGLHPLTVEDYVDLLEKNFVVFKLGSLSGNLRNEIKKGKKVYFIDTGVRNAVIRNFGFPENRIDTGHLFENFLVSERRKFLSNHGIFAETYFWRTAQKQEIDYVEVRNGKVFAYEFKLNPKRQAKFSRTFMKSYKVEKTEVITPENFENFLIKV